MQQDSNASTRNKRGQGGEWQETRNGRTVWVVSHPIPGASAKTWRDVKLEVALAKRQAWRDQLARGEINLTKSSVRQQLLAEDEPTVTLIQHTDYWLNNWVKPDYAGDLAQGDERERGKQPTTHANYVYMVERFVRPSRLAKVKLDELDVDDVEAFWREISRKSKGYVMRRKTMVMLRTMVNYVIMHRPRSTRLRWNPFASILAQLRKPVSKVKPAPDATILAAICSAAAGTDMELVVQIGLNFGLRRSNIAGLQFGDFDLAAGTLTVARRINSILGVGVIERGGLKGKDERAVSVKAMGGVDQVTLFGRLLGEQRKRNLELFMQNQARWVGPHPMHADAWLFPTFKGTRKDPNDIYRLFKEVVRAAGAPTYTLHQLRHDFVSIGLRSGRSLWEMSKAADHANSTITEEVYGHITSDHLSAAFTDVGAWVATNTRQDRAATG